LNLVPPESGRRLNIPGVASTMKRFDVLPTVRLEPRDLPEHLRLQAKPTSVCRTA